VKTVNLHAAKTNLSRLVDEAAAGEDIVIAKAGIPVARLVPFAARKRRVGFGREKGKLTVRAPHHADPFDRLLIAQAQLEHLTILTSDTAFDAYHVKVLDARR
jgi:prevent-host-death family protein